MKFFNNLFKKLIILFKTSIVFRNFSALAASSLIVQMLSILSSIRIARSLEPEGYGLYNLFLIQASFLGILAAFGLRLVVIRMGARNNELNKQLFKKNLKIKIYSTIITLIIAGFYNYFRPNNQFNSLLIFLLFLQVSFTNVYDSIDSLAFSNQKMEGTGFINLFVTFIWVALVYLLPKDLITVNMMVIVQVGSQILKTSLYFFWVFTKGMLVSQSIQLEIETKEIIRQSYPYMILAIFTSIQNQIPVLFLDHNSSLHEVGIFNLGYRILSPMQLFLNYALTALFPNLSSLIMTDSNAFSKIVKRALLIIIFIGVMGSLTFTIFSKEIIVFLYGVKYIASSTVVLVQCWFTVLFAIFCLIGTVLSATDKQNQLAWLSFIYAIVSTPILWYGSKFGAFGLSVSFLISALINLSYHWVYFAKILPKGIKFKYTALVFSILSIGAIIATLIPQNLGFFYKITTFIGLVIGITKTSQFVIKHEIWLIN